MRDTPPPRVAVLCGGRGQRLHPRTLAVPKPLVPVAGTPILGHILAWLHARGFADVVLCTGYKAEQVEQFCAAHFAGRLQLSYSNAGTEASMLARIVAASEAIDDRLIVVYGDTLTDLDLGAMLADHRASGALATIATARVASPFGVVDCDHTGRVTAFVEKPLMHYYIGYLIVEKEACVRAGERLRELRDGVGLVALFHELAAAGALHAYEHDGFRLTFNTERELAAAEDELHAYYTLREENGDGAAG